MIKTYNYYLIRRVTYLVFLLVAVRFDAGFDEGKLPVGRRSGGVAFGHTGHDMSRQLVLSWDVLVQVLTGNGREFQLH